MTGWRDLTFALKRTFVFLFVFFFTFWSWSPIGGMLSFILYPSRPHKIEFTPSLLAGPQPLAVHEGQVRIDNTPPVLKNLRPAQNTVVSRWAVSISGEYDEPHLLKIDAGGIDAQYQTNNKLFFLRSVPIIAGTNTIAIRAEDQAGNVSLNNLVIFNNIIPQVISATQETVIQFDAVTIRIPAGALETNRTIIITIEEEVGLPPNLIAISEVYGINPTNGDPLCFNDLVEISLRYDPAKIPPGFTERDIRIYVREDGETDWSLTKVKDIDTTNHIITALIPCFSDYMAGALGLPDSPQAGGGSQTGFGGLPIANPYEGLTFLSPPSISQDGSCNLTYPIRLSPGRDGLQPKVNLQYNSYAKDGLCGFGWNLPTDKIVRSTKKGIPFYTMDDVFLHNGRELVQVAPNEYRLKHESGMTKYIYEHADDTWHMYDGDGTVYDFGTIAASKEAVIK